MLHLLPIILAIVTSTILGNQTFGIIRCRKTNPVFQVPPQMVESSVENPFIVHLTVNCGGTIINKNWVLFYIFGKCRIRTGENFNCSMIVYLLFVNAFLSQRRIDIFLRHAQRFLVSISNHRNGFVVF
ncbi:hypothetical protein Zmor_018713 [Zophobas morio]|uniref:Uncharacterized protein n=1 Tax=Zophobas morio TaxID=2755281 RepID=A0AA38IBW4_9CUCU|nr:hypothetical protein Zmor_018713 [Zophobas morio]